MFKAFEFCLPTTGKVVPSAPEWFHEIKYDGYRLRLERDGERVRLITRGAALDAQGKPRAVVLRGRPDGSLRSSQRKLRLTDVARDGPADEGSASVRERTRRHLGRALISALLLLCGTDKPDLDNIAKAWNDALNSIVYRDDSLICRMSLDKRYGPKPLVVVTVKPMDEDSAQQSPGPMKEAAN